MTNTQSKITLAIIGLMLISCSKPGADQKEGSNTTVQSEDSDYSLLGNEQGADESDYVDGSRDESSGPSQKNSVPNAVITAKEMQNLPEAKRAEVVEKLKDLGEFVKSKKDLANELKKAAMEVYKEKYGNKKIRGKKLKKGLRFLVENKDAILLKLSPEGKEFFEEFLSRILEIRDFIKSNLKSKV